MSVLDKKMFVGTTFDISSPPPPHIEEKDDESAGAPVSFFDKMLQVGALLQVIAACRQGDYLPATLITRVNYYFLAADLMNQFEISDPLTWGLPNRVPICSDKIIRHIQLFSTDPNLDQKIKHLNGHRWFV